MRMTPDEEAKAMQEKAVKLYEHLRAEYDNFPDMGMVLCSTLMMIICEAEGKIDGSRTVDQLMELFIQARRLRDVLYVR